MVGLMEDKDDQDIKTARKSGLNLLSMISSLPSEDPNAKPVPAKKKKGKRGNRKKVPKKVSNCQIILRMCDAMMKECNDQIMNFTNNNSSSGTKESHELQDSQDSQDSHDSQESHVSQRQAMENHRVNTQCAIILAYSALSDAIAEGSSSTISEFVQTHIMPSLDPKGQLIAFPDWYLPLSPMLATHALFTLSRFAEYLPSTHMAELSLNAAMTMIDYQGGATNSVATTSNATPNATPNATSNAPSNAPPTPLASNTWSTMRIVAAHAIHQLLEIHFEDDEEYSHSSQFDALFVRTLNVASSTPNALRANTTHGEMMLSLISKLTDIANQHVGPYIERVNAMVCTAALDSMAAGLNIMNSETLVALGVVAGALRSFFLNRDNLDDDEEGEEGEEEEEEKETRESKEGKEGKEEKKETTDKEEKEGTVVEGKETPVAAMPAGRQRDLCERISVQLLVVLRRLLSPTGATTGGAGPTHVVSYHPDASMCVLFLTELVESIETTKGKADYQQVEQPVLSQDNMLIFLDFLFSAP